eukprot:scaffold12462_cov54-Cylindrotheca_fusiformis.AAC.1
MLEACGQFPSFCTENSSDTYETCREAYFPNYTFSETLGNKISAPMKHAEKRFLQGRDFSMTKSATPFGVGIRIICSRGSFRDDVIWFIELVC